MNNLKNDISKLAKNLLKQRSLDIVDIELAAIVTYSIFNKGYCKDAYNYLNLTRNIYNEYSLGHKKLAEVYGYTNQEVYPVLLSFNKKDDFFDFDNYNLEKTILTNEERDYLLKITSIIEYNKKDLGVLIDKINNLNEDTRNQTLFELILDKIETKNSFIKVITKIVNTNFSDEEKESFIKKYKIKNYSRPDGNSLSHYETQELISDYFIYKEKELISSALHEDDDDTKMTLQKAIDLMSYNLKRTDLNEFRKSDTYKGTLLEVVDIALQKDLTFNDKVFKIINSSSKLEASIDSAIKIYKSYIDKKTIDDLLNEYKDEIKLIENKIYKKYPDLLKEINKTEYTINKIVIEENSDDQAVKNYLDHYERNPNTIDIHLDNGYYNRFETAVISGITEPGYHRAWGNQRSNETYYEARNSLEVIGLLNVKNDRSFQNKLSYEDITNTKCCKIYSIDILSREDIDLNIIKSLVEDVVKNAREKDLFIVYDCISSPKYTEKRQLELKDIFIKIEEENKDIIFIDEGPRNDRSIIMKLRSQLIQMVEDNIIDYKKAKEIYQEINLNNKEVIKLIKSDSYIKELNATECLNAIIKNKTSNKLKV